VYTLTSLPLAIWLMKGFFDTIPTELEEQAYIDGATMFMALRKIILPLAAPGLAVTACFIFLSSNSRSILKILYNLCRKTLSAPFRAPCIAFDATYTARIEARREPHMHQAKPLGPLA
jgi:ABC-type glycerol-3-phosphate transport system permease component